MKAIASGNPAVLTLAEADAELQRLMTSRKHHADEQFLARRNVRELPETIARLKTRLDELSADLETATACRDEPATLDGVVYPREKFLSALGARLEALPEEVRETRRFVLGQMRGLTFGVVMHRFSAPEVFLEGRGERRSQLSRESQGPRAVSNALERLVSSYESRCEECRRDLALSEVKLRDFEARLGGAFPHERYIEELSALRDELKVALSATSQEGSGAEDEDGGGALGPHQRPQRDPHRRGVAGETTGRFGPVGAARHGPASKDRGSRPGRGPGPRTIRRAGEGGGGRTERGGPRPQAGCPKPVARAPRELRRRRYQKWMF